MKAVVWSKDDCPYCVAAKSLLQSKGYEVEERKLGAPWTVAQLNEAVPRARSVPQVFIDGEYIGNYDTLARHLGLKN